MNEYNDFDGDLPGDHDRLVDESLDSDILAMGENNNQTVLVVASTAVTGTQLFKTFDKNRVIVAINTKQLEAAITSNMKEAAFLVESAVDVGAYHFRW